MVTVGYTTHGDRRPSAIITADHSNAPVPTSTATAPAVVVASTVEVRKSVEITMLFTTTIA